MFVNCAWDGPDPRPGDWVTGKRGGALLIRDVHPRPGHAERLVLNLQKPRAGQSPPADAVLHPAARLAPHAPEGPARARQLARDGVAAVVPARWIDPADDQPTARAKAKTVRGWRCYCPLRRIERLRGTSITERHIAAADHMRLLYDLARLGPTAARIGELASSAYGPLSGPAAAAQMQSQADRELRVALDLFTPAQQRMLELIILRNTSLMAWCSLQAAFLGSAKPLEQRLELGRLLAVLDILSNHWRDHVDRLLFGNVVLPVS